MRTISLSQLIVLGLAFAVASSHPLDGTVEEFGPTISNCKDQRSWCRFADCSLTNVKVACQATCNACKIETTWPGTPVSATPSIITTPMTITTPPTTNSTITTTAPGTITCPSAEFFTFQDNCYKFSSNKLSWNEARIACQNIDGGYDLATIDGHELSNFVREKADSTDFWIGLHDLSKNGQYRWANGESSQFGSEHGKEPWHAGEPNNQGVENCVSLSNAGGLWNNLPCSYNARYICGPNGKHGTVTEGTTTTPQQERSWTCVVGQGESGGVSVEYGVATEKECGTKCLAMSGCFGFDFTEALPDEEISNRCRLYEKNLPRVGDGGVDNRVYCTVDLPETVEPVWRCGSQFPLPDGGPTKCNANSDYYCCSASGWCGNSPQHCECKGCVDYRKYNAKGSALLEMGIDYDGNDLESIYGYIVQSSQDCRNLCSNDPKCTYWTWHNEHTPNEARPKACYKKTSNRGRTNCSWCISGN